MGERYTRRMTRNWVPRGWLSSVTLISLFHTESHTSFVVRAIMKMKGAAMRRWLMSFCTTAHCIVMISENSTPGQFLFDIWLPKNCTLRWRSRGRRKKKQKVRQLDVAQLAAATREATTQEDTQPAATPRTATQLTTSLADVEESPIAQPTDSRSFRVLAGSESSAENVTDE
ncbi:trans-sialidase [Trypanosoma cruzi]|nr:trans-sialidase [Trypanosoma cruzi]